MKKLIPAMLLFLCANTMYAQPPGMGVYDGLPRDSTVLSFNPHDSLVRVNNEIDTTGGGVWKIGTTSKPFFATGGKTYAIMTDTLKAYDTSINNSFKVRLLAYNFNTILSFHHKYQTRNGKDGGIVEFSLDTGKTWNNVMGDCNTTGTFMQGIFTENFYKKTDTLSDGQAAFSGTSSGWQYSRIQMFIGLPIKSTGGGPSCVSNREIQYRFRFVSDNQTDTLDGWIIDDFKVEYDQYNGGITKTADELPVSIYPNPASNYVTIDMVGEWFKLASIINVTGQPVLHNNLRVGHNTINISQLPCGVYMLQLRGDDGIKTTRIIKE